MAKTKKSRPLLHVVTPVYNEGDNFSALYKQVKDRIKTPHKLIVVYDFDEDTTVPVARKLQKKDKALILLKNFKGSGARGALLSGFDYVKDGPVLVIMADLCDDLKIADKMFNEYQKGATVVCASRYMKDGKQVGGSLFRRSLSRLAGTSLYWIRRIPTHDITNNYRLYDKKFINEITIGNKGGFEVAMEITVRAFQLHRKIVEIPTTWRDRSAGESKFKLKEWLPSYLRIYFSALGPRSRHQS
jgi:dolichol-phosphate mannosyltransferase